MKRTFPDTTTVTVAGEYDALVAGGGIAGIAAAVAAARAGKRVLLLEKSVLIGGLATLGLITYYEPLCDGRGRKIIGGLGEELLHLAIRYGWSTLPQEWRPSGPGSAAKRYATLFSPSLFILALEELLQNEGVTLLLDTVICKAVMEQDMCRGLIVENKSGRLFYGGKMIVDATGDLDVMAWAGAPYEQGRNFLSLHACETDIDLMRGAVEQGQVGKGTRCRLWGCDRLGRPVRGDIPPGDSYSGIDGDNVTRFVLEGHRMVREEYVKADNTRRDLLVLPGMAQFRTTRRLVGDDLLDETCEGRFFANSVGTVCDFSRPGPVYEIPYGALITKRLPNLITAGRSISSKDHAWEVTRVIPAAALTGQAVGAASALALERGCSLPEIPIRELQSRLERAGVQIHL